MFVTYAQNFEDVMLHRALRDIDDGFYIDVGANDPVDESVTKVFYDRGWSGINLEPTDRMYSRLREHRPRDLNLNLAAWTESGMHTLFLIDGTDALATLEPAMAALHRDAGRTVHTQPIETISLRDICHKFVGDRQIHFMKIDVEGGELPVFQGHDFLRWRPWIILAEAHGPDFSVNLYQSWEDLLKASGYKFAYCDGLNRFFLAEEHYERLAPAFARPPNVYDEWVRASEVALQQRAEFAEHTRADAWNALEDAQRQVAELRAENEALRFRVSSFVGTARVANG